ncbi:unnamed protein product [marine sediment metagenome]|uniref:Uncharacterized protein n=1 Tax=marine sediment metagenome TaxID=412755 RepID=X0VNN9_9ZZZZ
MDCRRCTDAEAMKHTDLCGICEIIEAKGKFGVQTASLIPSHFNIGIGEYVEDRDDHKRKMERKIREGVISDYE